MWRVIFLGLIFGILTAGWFVVGWVGTLILYLFVGALIALVAHDWDAWYILIPLWAPIIASEKIRDWYMRK